MDTHLQRPTDTLLFTDTKQQIQSLFDASYLISKGQYTQGIKYLQDILVALPQKKYNAFQLEVKYNKILAQIYSSRQFPVNVEKLMQKCIAQFIELLQEIESHEEEYFDQEEEDEWQVAEDLRIRIYISILQLSVKCQTINFEEWLTKLIQKLKLYPSYLPEVFGKLCGCKYLKDFCFNFNSDQILSDNRRNLIQKAELLDLASSWLIVGGQYDKGIKCKQQAVDLYKKSNSLNESSKCQRELRQLQRNDKAEYCIELKKVARIVTIIFKQLDQQLEDKKNKTQKHMSLIVKKSMSKNLRQIQDFNDQLDLMEDTSGQKKDKGGLWSSSKKSISANKKSLKNDSKLSEYYQKSNEFFTQVYLKQQHQEITSLLDDKSKFIFEQRKVMSKIFMPLLQQFTKRQKFAFYKLKSSFTAKYGPLKSESENFLKGSQIKKEAPPQNLTQKSSFQESGKKKFNPIDWVKRGEGQSQKDDVSLKKAHSKQNK